MWKKLIFWILAIVITLGSAVYQRMTGPSYPKSYEIKLEDQSYNFSLPRSQNGITDAMISIEIPNAEISGHIFYRKYKSGQDFDTIKMHRENDELVVWLPKQPAAGKLEYGLRITNPKNEIIFSTPENIIIRFKGNVPPFVLIPHVIFIFIAMLLSNLTGFYAVANLPSYKFYTMLTLLFFLIGGMMMGPIVQKYAFGELWTGFPIGKDLTDNKALIAFLFWVIAWFGNRKSERKYLVIIAAIANLAVFLIPHSLRGSELDYASGEINTGIISILQFIH